jgi:hypothetical protein
MLGLILTLFVIAIVASVGVWLITYIAPPEPIKKILIAALVIICLIWFVMTLGGAAPVFVVHSYR